MVENQESNVVEQVTAIIWKQGENGLEFLLVQELDGVWSLPGGAKESVDNNLSDAMKRELKEELGLEESEYELTPTEIQARFLYDRPSSPRYGKVGVLSLFLMKPKDYSSLAPTTDLMSIQWYSVEEAKKKFIFEHHKELADSAAKLLDS